MKKAISFSGISWQTKVQIYFWPGDDTRAEEGHQSLQIPLEGNVKAWAILNS